MNEIIQSFIEDPSKEENKLTAFPAANSTSAYQNSTGYMHVIVAVYAIIVVLVILTIIIIATQSIRKAWMKTNICKYSAFTGQRVGSLNPETIDDNFRFYGSHPEGDSEFVNIFVSPGREDHDDNESDDPPLYEYPPSYHETGYHNDHKTDVPPIVENPPLSITR